MKNLLAIGLLLVFIFCPVGCTRQNFQEQNSKLTLENVIELSDKGMALTWSDFEQYESVDTGSGLYILVYDIDETFALWVGGASTEEDPFYIRLLTKTNIDNHIDIRTDDVREFIRSNKNEEPISKKGYRVGERG